MDVRLQNNIDGTLAGVTPDNHLKVAGRTIVERDAEALAENSYSVNTGLITLTSANESSVFYYKNTDTVNHVISRFTVFLGTSTGGSGDWTITVRRNPIGGTIVSGASAVAINQNNHFGSNNALSATIYKGAEGNTLTNGDDLAIFGATESGRNSFALTYTVLSPGSSIGLKITPPTGNTSAKVYVALEPVFRITLSN